MKLFKKWSNWTDLATGLYAADFYLLQAKRRSDGKVKFRVAKARSAYGCPPIQISDLNKILTP